MPGNSLTTAAGALDLVRGITNSLVDTGSTMGDPDYVARLSAWGLKSGGSVNPSTDEVVKSPGINPWNRVMPIPAPSPATATPIPKENPYKWQSGVQSEGAAPTHPEEPAPAPSPSEGTNSTANLGMWY